ncbi:unnamed protein product [Caenorhabditis sp. 36 PRJEB53466]|nr:unnamed protein product [Caenorhabditis sp. 36 PRJEB53466]
MNRFSRKAKHEPTKQPRSSSRSSSSTPQKKKESVSESDSRSEKPAAKPEKSTFRKRVDATTAKPRVDSPEKEKQNTAQIIKKTVASLPFSPSRIQKTPPLAEDKRKKHALKSESDEVNMRKLKEGAIKSLSGSNEISLEHVPSRKKSVKSERSLIGLDGETELNCDRRSLPKKTLLGSSTPLRSSRSQEDASETKDYSISLADDEEQRDTYKKLFKELGMSTQKLTLDDFLLEFNSLPGDPPPEHCVAFNSSVNQKKNRYTNIPCLDTSRVRLTFRTNKNQPGAEYIHANYIKSPFLKRDYILTQGPKKETVADFWRMVWQEQTAAIVMLCQFVETNREKCVEYFPRNANCTLRFDKLVVSYEDSTVNKTMVTTRLKLHYEGEARVITHFQWKEWPDYQVPGSSEVMLKILRKIRARSSPPIIHCAAGVGRSGTLMAVEIALQAINSHFKVPDIKQIVIDLRLNGRACAVQTVQQYMLIWKVVLDFGVSNKLISEEIAGKFASTYRRSFRTYNSS